MVTPIRLVGIFLVLIWGAYCASITALTLSSLRSGGLPFLFWWSSSIALVGLAAGILAICGTPHWKWLALVSSVAFITMITYAWSTQPGPWLEVVEWYLKNNRRAAFDGLVMPLFAAIAGVLAVWRIVRDVFGSSHVVSRRV
jgi:hypothetical protein